jgi:hypothetical protein
MSPAAPAAFADTIVACSSMSLEYGVMLAKDIPAERFAERPHATMNHPAFLYGHLCLYPNRVAELVEAPTVIELPATYPDLFAAGVPCEDDRGQYPHKDELLKLFTDGHHAANDAILATDPDVFAKENPMERMRERFPTVGVAVNFLMNNHLMMHLGQLSTWRRAVGLPSVM